MKENIRVKTLWHEVHFNFVIALLFLIVGLVLLLTPTSADLVAGVLAMGAILIIAALTDKLSRFWSVVCLLAILWFGLKIFPSFLLSSPLLMSFFGFIVKWVFSLTCLALFLLECTSHSSSITAECFRIGSWIGYRNKRPVLHGGKTPWSDVEKISLQKEYVLLPTMKSFAHIYLKTGVLLKIPVTNAKKFRSAVETAAGKKLLEKGSDPKMAVKEESGSIVFPVVWLIVFVSATLYVVIVHGPIPTEYAVLLFIGLTIPLTIIARRLLSQERAGKKK